MFELFTTISAKASCLKGRSVVKIYEMDEADEHDKWKMECVTSKPACLTAIEQYLVKVVQLCVNAQSTDFATFPSSRTEPPLISVTDITHRINSEQNMRARLLYTNSAVIEHRYENKHTQ